MPPLMSNHGNYIASLGNVCRWLAQQAEALGVEIYPGFAAAEVLFNERRRGDAASPPATWGSAATATHKADYQPGMELHAKYTLFAEGARGSLSKELMKRFDLRDGIDPQKYGIGLKELWQVEPATSPAGPGRPHARAGRSTKHRRRLVHLPLRRQPGRRSGFVVHLNYENPYLSPFDEFQRFKTHPAIRHFLRGRQARSPTARARSTRAGCSRCRSSPFRAAR